MRLSMKPVSLRGNYHLEEKKSFAWVEIYCAITAGLSFFCIGTQMAYTSPAVLSMKKDITFNHTLTSTDYSWFAAAPSLGALKGVITCAPLLQFAGRKKSIITSNLQCLIGWLLIGFATNMTMAIIGRVLVGAASGMAITASPLYVSECARPRRRGTLGILCGFMLALGTLVGLLIGTALFWRCAALTMTIFPVIFFAMSCFLPESPTWLLMNDRESHAIDSLKTIRGTGRDVKLRKELDEVRTVIEDTKESYRKLGFVDVISRQEVWWPMCLTIFLMIFQQFSGANALMYYLENILVEAETASRGGKLSMAPAMSSIVVGAVYVLAFFISLPLIDWVGRRTLLLTSAVLMALAHLSLGTYFYLCDQHKNDKPVMTGTTSWLPLSSLCVFVAGYSIGFASIPFLIASEVFPPHLRSYLSSVNSIIYLLGSFLVVQFFPFVKETLTPGYIFYFCMIICLTSIIITLYAMPETKGKSLAKIQQYFRTHNSYDDEDLEIFSNSSLDNTKTNRYLYK